jgi:hypothetical protein
MYARQFPYRGTTIDVPLKTIAVKGTEEHINPELDNEKIKTLALSISQAILKTINDSNKNKI